MLSPDPDDGYDSDVRSYHFDDLQDPALDAASRGVFDVGVLELLLALGLILGGIFFYQAFDSGKEWETKRPGLWKQLLGR